LLRLVYFKVEVEDTLNLQYVSTIDVDVNNNEIGIGAQWTDGKYQVNVEGNSADMITIVGANTTQTVSGNDIGIAASYEVLSQKISAKASVTIDDAIAVLNYNSADQDPILSVEKPIDENNSVIPCVSCKTGAINLGYLRRWAGGSLRSTFYPKDKVILEWKDQGTNGVWTTTADVPLDDTANTKISFSRDWNY
jgi:hypothetical protein